MSDAPGAGLYLGLISGTSADGIDVALVSFATPGAPSLVLGRTFDWDDALRSRLVELGQGGELVSLDEYGTLDARVADAFASAAKRLLDEAGMSAADVVALGSHGQTVRHRPRGAAGDGRYPFTLQLGDGHRIAERTGIATVAEFRRRDVAAGGQGAPLLPGLHAALLHDPGEDRAVLNLGGIANLTLLPARGDCRGFDTGPANALLDAWAWRHAEVPYDAGGAFAASGTVDKGLLDRLRDDPWLSLPPPKSSGREHFHLSWLAPRLRGNESPADVQATLLAFTAVTVCEALQHHQPGTRRVIACGGGVHNPYLMGALAERLPGVTVETTARHGLDPDFVEAIGFAWLARQTMLARPGNLPAVTGASGPRVLGCVHPA
ncbi:MAG TPA: anhydro-N-acetylmuramic acid kinase [Xanthomonadaceae bacterium]|nr:anhydro-N-acetylmuramic acid kinase [Xanthomonadaceae bacterium]